MKKLLDKRIDNMDQIDYQAFKEKIDYLTLQNKQLSRTNARLKRKNKQLQYTIRKLKKESEEQNKKKQHYRNGRERGSYGRHG